MSRPDLHNPETAAIGLDASALEGKSIAEVRKIVDGDDCALVIATEDVPPQLPEEVMEKEPDAIDGMASLTWMYQSEAGEWRHWYCYGVDADYVRRVGGPVPEVILGQIYTKRARATPGIRVRPIVEIAFDRDGICVSASAEAAQFHLFRVRSEEREE
jgi:hypothetical protein